MNSKKWSEIQDWPCSIKGNIYPSDEKGCIPPNSEPDIYYEFSYQKGVSHQEIYRRIIRDLTASLEQLIKQGLD